MTKTRRDTLCRWNQTAGITQKEPGLEWQLCFFSPE